MNRLISFIAGSIWIGGGAWVFAPRAQAAKTQIPPPPKSAKEEQSSYQDCRKDALKLRKKGRIALRLSICQEQYPGAERYIQCKKEVLKEYKSKKKARSRLKACKAEQRALMFDPKEVIPFDVKESSLYFAGVGLNLPRKWEGYGMGNYNCTHLASYLETQKGAEYLLFGNHPKVYQGLKGESLKGLLKKLKAKKQGNRWVSPTFGELDHVKKPDRLAHYFPLASCSFERRLGRLYEGVKIFFLPEAASKFVFPYFGVAFYTKQVNETARSLAQKIAEALGSDYKIQNRPNKTFYIATTPFTEFDEEGDPYNLCQDPSSPYVGLVRARAKLNKPDFALIANVQTLCRFGERMAGKL